MNNLREVFEKSKKRMFFKDLDFFEKLDDKQRKTMFYPGMILSFADYTNYPLEDAKDLALLAQLLSYSIEIHEIICKDKEINDLVILEGDHLYSRVFLEITTSKHIKHISKFTDYIRNYSEKKIMFIDGLISLEEVNEYKYKRVSRVITEIIAPDNKELLEISEKISDLFILYATRAKKDMTEFEWAKEKFIIDSKKDYDSKMFGIIEYIINSMEGVSIEK